ncbi:MAG: hypothetical protein V4691_01675 [Pseudomonadota bacterium]
MGDIVDLASERDHRGLREYGAESPHGPAQVVLYTGVRYERAEEPPVLPPTKTTRSRRKSKPKNS